MLDRYMPSRWVNNEVSPEARKAFHPLGSGSRACIGMHLAYMELRLATTEFFRVFKDARLAPSVTPRAMETVHHFAAAPMGHKCEIVLAEA